MNRHSRINKTILLLIIVVAIVAAACSRSSDDSAPLIADGPDAAGEDFFRDGNGDSGAPTEPAPPPSPGAPQDPGREVDLGSGGIADVTLQPIDFGRDIIFRADLTVAVSDVAAAGAEATTIIESLGGFVFGQQTSGRPNPRSVLTFKILPDNFQAALAALGSIGELRNQNVTADDVTDRIVDIESRIATAEASVARLRAFLEDANDIVTIAELERELLNRETTLETLRGQLRTLQDQVALATIILNLTTADIDPGIELFVSTYPGHEDSGGSCPGDSDQSYVEGDDVTVCFEIFNSGDTGLTGLTLRDNVLDVDLDGLTLVFGDPGTLEPGESLILAVEISPDRDLRTQTRVTAEPTNLETGGVIEGRTVSSTRAIFIDVRSEEGLPGFSEALSESFEVLKNVGRIGIVVVGAVIPFLWVLVLAAAWYVLRRRRRSGAMVTAPSGGAQDGDQPVVESEE